MADVFLLPSELESFGLSALEAMACGVPVVGSDAGGLPEVVKHTRDAASCCPSATSRAWPRAPSRS